MQNRSRQNLEMKKRLGLVMGKFSSELNCLFFVNFEPELQCSVQTCLNLNTELEVQCSEFKVQFKMEFEH